MKKILLFLLALIFSLSTLVGCGVKETTQYKFVFNDYEDLVDIDWSYFIGKVEINNDENFKFDESSNVKITIDHASIVESFVNTKNEPIVPMFEINAIELGDTDLNTISQFSVDAFNPSNEDFYLILYAYSGQNVLFYGDVKVVHAGRWNNVNFNVNRLFYHDFGQSIEKFALGVYKKTLNQNGLTVYLDNLTVSATDEIPVIDKSFVTGEVLSFRNGKDMKYVNYFQNEPNFYVAPSLYGYLTYVDGAISINSLGIDGFLSVASDSYNPENQGFGFEILPELIEKTSSGGEKELIATVENIGEAPRLISLIVADKNGKEIKVEKRIAPYENTEISINIRNIGGVVTKIRVMCDSWNAGEEFEVKVSDIRYGEVA